MQETEFYQWLISNGYDESTSRSRKTNCVTVCSYEGDLDKHFDTDRCNNLIKRLTYSTQDQINNRKQEHKIPINGNVRTGSATLKQAVKLYVQFRSNTVINRNKVSNVVKVIKNSRPLVKKEWPKWDQPNDDEIYLLARVSTKYIRFLNPEIIHHITLDNEKNKNYFAELLEKKSINSSLYVWDKSPCCFPGIRRYAGSKEISFYRKQSHLDKNTIPNALRLDDNDFPKQIWSFIFRGLQFSKFGPENYSLAHLIDHKESKNRMEQEFVFTNDTKYKEPFYGLYTCPSNTVYIPNNLLKPTDFNLKLRNLLFNKAQSLYGKFCSIIPEYIQIPKSIDVKWNIDQFEWSEPVGSLENMELFLNYRKKIMEKLLNEDF